MKVVQARAAEEVHPVWTAAIKRIIHPFLEHRNKRRALWRGSAENQIESPFEGHRWCDATERELLGDIANNHGSYL